MYVKPSSVKAEEKGLPGQNLGVVEFHVAFCFIICLILLLAAGLCFAFLVILILAKGICHSSR